MKIEAAPRFRQSQGKWFAHVDNATAGPFDTEDEARHQGYQLANQMARLAALQDAVDKALSEGLTCDEVEAEVCSIILRYR